MKIDFVVGNPPYQTPNKGANATYLLPVYHEYMRFSYEVGKRVVLITPSRFLFSGHRGLKSWKEKITADTHFKILYDFDDRSTDVFPDTEIKGGIIVSLYDKTKSLSFMGGGIYIPYPLLSSILYKVEPYLKDGSMMDIAHLSNQLNLEAFHRDFPSNSYNERRLRTNIFDLLPEIFSEEPIEDSIRVYGRSHNKRTFRYCSCKYIDNSHPCLNKWKVALSKNIRDGRLGEPLTLGTVLAPEDGYTYSFIGFGPFETKQEAENVVKYLQTKFVRIMLGILKKTAGCYPPVWKYIPVQDFTDTSDINWSLSVSEIDRQLYEKYGLTEEEIEFIKKVCKPFDK